MKQPKTIIVKNNNKIVEKLNPKIIFESFNNENLCNGCILPNCIFIKSQLNHKSRCIQSECKKCVQINFFLKLYSKL